MERNEKELTIQNFLKYRALESNKAFTFAGNVMHNIDDIDVQKGIDIGGHGRTPQRGRGWVMGGQNRFSKNLIFKRFEAKS